MLLSPLAILRRPRATRHAYHYEHVLGTSLEVQLVATRRAAVRAESVVLSEVDRLSDILSGYSATSELMRWQGAHGTVQVSPELAEVLDACERWRIRTGGAFNPAAVSLVEMLRDVDPPDGGPATLDHAALNDAIRDRIRDIDQPHWWVDRASCVAQRLTTLAISLDALAKGWIVDRVAMLARDVDGVTQVMVNIGGDIRHLGERPIKVRVTDPRAPADNAAPIAEVMLCGEALATSGGYRRGFTVAGRRASHIMDARNGRPADDVISASVIAPDCATADALSTAFSVMRPAESLALADSLDGVGCLLVERDGTITTNATWQSRSGY
jgi:thiamine biosynthesis lipoprotein